MEGYAGKVLILGCGSICQCVLPLLFKHIQLKPSQITIMDFTDNKESVAPFLREGVQYVVKKLTPHNYPQLLSHFLQAGDFLIDLAYNTDTVELVDWCHHNQVLFLNTSVEMWEPYHDVASQKTTDLTLYARQMKLRQKMAGWGMKGTTCIVDHGANPGLISHFVKCGLRDIGEKILREKPDDPRHHRLERALSEKNFAQIAHLVGLKTIHISEKDTQITNQPKRINEFVNTWSIPGLIEESRAPAEIGWGTHELTLPENALLHDSGPQNQICLSKRGMDTWVRSWVPSGEIIGMVIRHGEAFGLSDYLTVQENNQVIYRPTVHYAYCLCDGAMNSLHEYKMRNLVPQESFRILLDDITEGADELGALLLGHDFSGWWTGSVLDIHQARKLVPHQNATTVQVAIGVVAALIYALKHPDLGVCLPEHLDEDEILAIAKPYLGQFISEEVDWNPLENIENFLDYHELPPSEEHKWQFSTFAVSHYKRNVNIVCPQV